MPRSAKASSTACAWPRALRCSAPRWCSVGAYLLEKTRVPPALRGTVRLLAMLPMAVPGLVLGLGYIFFFNEPGNPLNGLYHTMTLLTLCSIVHFYTTGHLTAVTALKSLDAEFEAVSASLKVPFYKTFWRVTLPICTPALVDIARYFFVNAMTTISAVVFLYSPETKVASIAILNLDEAGEIGAAAACAVMIAAASAVATLLFWLLSLWIRRGRRRGRHEALPLPVRERVGVRVGRWNTIQRPPPSHPHPSPLPDREREERKETPWTATASC
jgi:ABC-type spermidine/putrescine transport system permease subunit II